MRLFIYLIIAVKIAFVVLAIAYMYFRLKKDVKNPRAVTIQFWKERMEFMFVFLMSVLLIGLFNPRTPQRPLTYETRLLLFLFGIVLMITADWGTFFKESPALKRVQSALAPSKRF